MLFLAPEIQAPSRTEPRVKIQKGIYWLMAAAVITVVLWQIPGGNYILYPCTILATWFHEMAHGLMALLLGGRFSTLLVYADGSGVARFTGPLLLGPIGMALVAAAGPTGPPLAGAGLILASRNSKTTSVSLLLLGGLLLASTIVWVRSSFGLIAVPALGVAVLGVWIKGSESVRAFAVQFLGVQACVSTYRQIDYLFSYSACSLGLSDTAQMQKALWLPYWFWGGVIAVTSFIILAASLRYAYRS